MTTTKLYQLPREFAEKWVKALRSREYKQTTGMLGNKHVGYCCLGVGCVISGANDEELDNESIILYRESGYGISKAVLDTIPDELKGGYKENNLVRQLTEMNDEGKTFSEIADWIEQNVEFV